LLTARTAPEFPTVLSYNVDKKNNLSCSVVDPDPVDPSFIGLLDPDPEFCYYGSGALLLIKDVKKFRRKVQHFKIFSDVPVGQHIFINGIKNVQVESECGRSAINFLPGSVSQDPDEIFTDPQHCYRVVDINSKQDKVYIRKKW
jgi:hypothetical protein